MAMRQKAMEMAVADPTWVGVDLGMVMGLRNRHGTGPQGWGRLYSGSHSLTEREIPGEWRYQYGCCCETLLSSEKGNCSGLMVQLWHDSRCLPWSWGLIPPLTPGCGSTFVVGVAHHGRVVLVLWTGGAPHCHVHGWIR